MRQMVCVMVAVAANVAMLSGVWADEEKIPLDKLPKAVVEAVKKRFPKAEMKEASKEVEDGKTTYEVTVVDDKQNIDVTLTPEGALVSIEKEIAVKDLPKVIADAVMAKYPKGKMTKAEEVIKVKDGKETLEYYEVILTDGDKKDIEVQIFPDGKIKAEEKKPEEKKPETKK